MCRITVNATIKLFSEVTDKGSKFVKHLLISMYVLSLHVALCLTAISWLHMNVTFACAIVHMNVQSVLPDSSWDVE